MVVNTISILGLHDALSSTGAPTWAATSFSRRLMNFTNSGRIPTVTGHMPLAQRAIFPVSRVGVASDPTKPCSTSLDRVPVTVTFSLAGRAAWPAAGSAQASGNSHAKQMNRRPLMPCLMTDVVGVRYYRSQRLTTETFHL